MPFTPVNTGIREMLRDPEQRHDFFKAMTQDDIAEQIRDLRKRRDLTQKAFARIADMKQSAVSRIEQAEYSKWTLTTLFRVAAALDARWRMILEPCEEAVTEFEGIDDQPAAQIPVEAAARLGIKSEWFSIDDGETDA